MINLKENVIVFESKATPISRWEVWFMTPVGLHRTKDEAFKFMDIEHLIVPVAVACTDGDLYEVAVPR